MDFQLLAKGIALAGCAIGLLLIFVAPGMFMNFLS